MSLVYCAAAVNFSPWIQSFHQSDTLLRALMSTLRWTPFYWTENRLGNLTPLLAMGVRNPLPNLLFQTQIHALACLLCVWLIVSLCAERGRAFGAESLACTQIVWLLAAASLRLNWQSVPSLFLGEPYALSMALLLAALFLALRDVRLPHGIQHALIVPLSFLAFWLYIPHVALAVVLLPIFPGAKARIRSRAIALAEILLAFAMVYAWERTYPGPNFHGLAGIRQIPHAITQLWWGASHFILDVRRLSWIAGFGCVLATVRFWRARNEESVRREGGWPLRALAILFGALVLLGMLVVSAWVRDNLYTARFLMSSVILIVPIACYPLARTLVSLGGSSKAYASAVVSVACVAVATVTLGFPSPAKAEVAVDRLTGADAPAIAELGCTRLMGDYWQVWPRVFYRNAHPTGTPLWGVALRAPATRDLWDVPARGTRSYCSICGDPQAGTIGKLFRLGTLQPDGRNSTICRYREEP